MTLALWLLGAITLLLIVIEYLQVLLELLQAGGIVQFEENRLIQMAEKAEL